MTTLEEFEEQLDPRVFDGYALLTPDGEVLAEKGSYSPTPREARELVETWLTTRGGGFVLRGVRYAVLKSEPEQLAARNVGGGGAIVGGPTRDGYYGIAHVRVDAPAQLGPVAMVFCDLVWNVEI
ncbi:MAG: hypothetical protein ACTSU5_21430 [Promethearchaeota archaeon]